jgi:hypothetical protein
MQIQILIDLIENQMVHFPSRRQARQVAHSIVAHLTGSDRLVHMLNFDRVNTDPRVLKQRRDPNIAEKFRSVAATDDIVIGTMKLSVCLQGAGEPTLDVSIRRRLAKIALQLDLSLRDWQKRGLDGSGGKATSLTQEEKGWAYVATVECLAALEVSSVLETLNSVWLENVEAIFTAQDWVVRRRLGGGAGKDWVTHLERMKKWIEEANSIFEER